jgi:hypothetical protein
MLQVLKAVQNPSNKLYRKYKNFGFYLSTTSRNSEYRRMVLKGATSKAGIKLDIVYSKIK